MLINEARGKEGQHGFDLMLRDSASQLHGLNASIEVEYGNTIEGPYEAIEDELVEFVRSTGLNRSVQWKVRKIMEGLHTGHLYARAHKGPISFTASAPTKSGLDSMIAILSTLKAE